MDEKLYANTVFVTKSSGETLLNTGMGLRDRKNKQAGHEEYFQIYNFKNDFWMCFGLFGGVRIVYYYYYLKFKSRQAF